jgi:hypothetical protein
MNHHPLNHSDAIKFIFAGNSLVTFLNTKSNNRFTYNVKLSKDGSVYFVSVLTMPEHYEFIGIISGDYYRHGNKSKITKEAQSVKVFEYIVQKLKSNTLPDFIEIWHEGKCGKCGRTLTVPNSIENGIGPECIKKITDPLFRKKLHRDNLLRKLLGED